MPLLPCFGVLQNGKLRRGQELRRYASLYPPILPIVLMWPKVDCWRKSLQISKPRASTLSLKRRLPEVNYLPKHFRHPLTHSLRWIYRNGHCGWCRSRRCFAAHELGKEGSAQIIPIYNCSSNAVAFVMLLSCSRTGCLSPRTLSTSLRHSSLYYVNFRLARVLYNKPLLTLHTRCARLLENTIIQVLMYERNYFFAFFLRFGRTSIDPPASSEPSFAIFD